MASSEGIGARAVPTLRSESTSTHTPSLDRLLGLGADALQRPAHAVGALGHRPGDVDGVGLEHRGIDAAHLLELVVAQDGLGHHELVRVLGGLVEQVALGAHRGLKAHHELLADRVDGRVGDLGEELLEVVEQRRLAVGEDGQRDVVAHGAVRLGGVARHRPEQHAQVLLGEAEGELARAQRLGARHARRALGQVVEVDDVLAVPVAVGPAGGHAALGLAVGLQAARLQVGDEELAGVQAALDLDVGLADGQHAGLGGQQHVAALGEHPAAGAQAVAVERRADRAAVGEGDRRRPVPGLHEARVVGVEVAQLGGQLGVVLPRARDHHHRRVLDRAAPEHQQLEHAVERRRVRQAGADDRQQLGQVVTEGLRAQRGLARAHPVDVAHQRVDLAVVGDHPVGVGELPARERVGREARVHERQAGLGPRVLQVAVEVGELKAREHPLVDHGARGQAGHHQVGRGPLGDAADHEQLALERVLVAQPVGGGHEELADGGCAGARARSRGGERDRDLAPAYDPLALGDHGALEQRLELGAPLGVGGQEAHGHAVAPGGGQVGIEHAAVELVGHLEEDPGAVAGLRVRSGRTAVEEVLDRRDPVPQDLVARGPVQARDEGDAAGVVLVARVVEAAGHGAIFERSGGGAQVRRVRTREGEREV